MLAAITDDEWAAAPPAPFPAPLQSWLPATGVLTAREREGDTAGLFLAAKAGHNDESHNHNDVGSFIVAYNGRPLLIDPGAGLYTRQTFGPDRYQIWTMQSSWHNTPAPAGHAQAAGRAHRATDVSASLSAAAAELALDLAAAYPAAAGVRSWRRTLRLDRGGPLIAIHDSWELSEASQRTVCYLITPEEPQVAGATIMLPSGLVIDIDATVDGASAGRHQRRAPRPGRPAAAGHLGRAPVPDHPGATRAARLAQHAGQARLARGRLPYFRLGARPGRASAAPSSCSRPRSPRIITRTGERGN